MKSEFETIKHHVQPIYGRPNEIIKKRARENRKGTSPAVPRESQKPDDTSNLNLHLALLADNLLDTNKILSLGQTQRRSKLSTLTILACFRPGIGTDCLRRG